MQDLEELKEMLNKMKMHDGIKGLTISQGLDLIARCESAEKDCESWGILCKQAAIERDAALAELKEQREQKQYPIGQFTGHFEFKNNQAHINVKCFDEIPTVGAYLYSAPEPVQGESVVMQWREIGESDWETTADSYWFASCEKSPEHDTRKLPVAQSLDSAEPYAYSYEDEDSCEGVFYCKMNFPWLKEVPLYRNLAQSNANDHIEPANTPEIPDSSIQQSPAVAVPDGFRLVPIDPTDEMIEAAHEVAGPVGEGFGSDHADHYRAMLSAAPQASAEPDSNLTEAMEIVKCVAHIGVDFGFGEYHIEQSTIDKARKLVAQDEGKV